MILAAICFNWLVTAGAFALVPTKYTAICFAVNCTVVMLATVIKSQE